MPKRELPPRIVTLMEGTEPLKQRLAKLRAFASEFAPADVIAVMEDHIDLLRSGSIARTILKVGDYAPPIVLGNAKGVTINVADLRDKGPVIITFYRGNWCPYCNMELRAFQQALPEITAVGASLVAISPEAPDQSLSTTEKGALKFEVLSDVGQKIGRAFGLVYDFTDELKRLYRQLGNDLEAHNDTPGEWALPVSATYVLDRSGRIAFADVGIDYRDRADPIDVLEFLKS
jgi:peroxiredoxin